MCKNPHDLGIVAQDIVSDDGSVANTNDEMMDEEGDPNRAANLPSVQEAMSSLAADIIVKLRSNNSVTGTTISLVLDHLSSCFEILKGHLESNVKEVVTNHNID